MTFLLRILFSSILLASCMSPSDKQHSCECDYDDNSEMVIKGVKNYSDLEPGIICDKKCEFKRLLILFYNESDSSKKIIKLIESNPTLVNNINDNFAFVCLTSKRPSKNLDFQITKFKSDAHPYFAVMSSSKDSLIASFGYITDSNKIDSILISTLYR